MKLTLLALAEHANPAGENCYPGVETLARQTSQGEKTCRRALDAADGRWFTRTPMKFSGRHWRGYSYQLRLPDGAVTMTGPRREVAVTMTGTRSASCGHSGSELRSLSPRAAVTVTDELGKATRKSNKESPRSRSEQKTFSEWSESCQHDDEKLMPGTDPVFTFAEDAGIPVDDLYLAWRWFCHRYREDSKRYRDWRSVFRRCVREDWHRCWRRDRDGQRVLTEVGLQLQRELEAEERDRTADAESRSNSTRIAA
ncbi:helix-turn-helix domain-containing protein [Marilutibacter maris]